jgi:heat shock protein HslJ
MKSMIAFAFFMLFLAGIALVNLRNVSEQKAAQQRPVTKAELLARDWRLLELGAVGDEHAGDVRIAFQEDDRLAVAGPCNRFNGQYELGDGGLRVHTLAGTRQACSNEVMQAETSLLEVLAGTASVHIENNALRLRAADGKSLALFVAAQNNEGE